MRVFFGAMTPRLFTSNRVERLIEALAEVLRRPLSSPFETEVIVVQSKGMEHYLSMQLARRLGIWANCRYPFPNAFVEELFQTLVPETDQPSPFDPDILTWRIMRVLPALLGQPAFGALHRYTEGEDEDLRCLQLSESIADTFDQYLLFRPDMILQWEKGGENHWQAQLWNHLRRGQERKHRAAMAREFIQKAQGPGKPTGLPERVSVFGISALPRFHMEILAALSRFTEVNLFVMNPCREYWGGDMDTRDSGLLNSLGRLGRDFIDLLIDLGWEEISVFDEPGEDTLLHSMQSDILNLREPETAAGNRALSHEDQSVQFHACHSPMREVEVLRDRILEMLESDASLKPGEILVMTPDIRSYAPYIQAVFDLPPSDPTFIPYGIADRSVRQEGRVIEPFLSMLDLAGSRFGATQILGILESHSVCKKFGLEEKELEGIRRWVVETRIRWGTDEKSREDAGVVPFRENTWRAGIDRLLLGYALPAGNERMFENILPYDPIEGADAGLLGRFVEFLESLFAWVRLLEGRRSLEEWSGLLARGVERFFDPEGESQGEIRLLRKALTTLGGMGSPAKSGYDGSIDLKAIRWYLAGKLQKEGFGTGFLTGGVTFCAMLPMRSIPFRVLCLIGMNSDAYPRESHAPGFDLITKEPRKGDRSRRNDDRYLFLEAVLSARERLYISYVGRSIQDNSVIQPSVLVTQLQDYIVERFDAVQEGVADRLLTVHGLQPFSPRYFRGDEKLFSYSEEHCATARTLLAERVPPEPFVGAGLSAPEEEYRSIALSDLCRFYSNPCRFLLQRRLGLYLEEGAALPEDREPMEISGLEKYRIEQAMFNWALGGKDLGQFFPLARGAGQIPPGRVGECIHEELSMGVEEFLKQAGTHIRKDCLRDVSVDRRIGPFRLSGRIDHVNPSEMVRYRYGRLRGSDYVTTWIMHLALNCLAPSHYPKKTMILGLGEKKGRNFLGCRFSPVDDGETLLAELLEIYWEGMVSALHFFPESSWAYARSIRVNEGDAQEALRRGRMTWSGGDWERGESEDPYYRICFKDLDPLDRDFAELSNGILKPLLEHMNQEG